MQNQLIDEGYNEILIDAVGTGGGSFEENNLVIEGALIGIHWLLSHLHDENEYHISSREFLKGSFESIEENGGIEEIDSQISNKGNNDLSRNAQWVLSSIFNHH
ncbi:MAG: hypothetical protein EZS28_002989 [Streblomastix strix]|uniref:Uncharacterized protein n=1 Tax=Streblomastix strix TaxID=222440 RepID=A0A5J4X415_9EUKA|nr:MAG: hypothetical protein EZS28_002989 [Streblomastix strix]